MSDEVKIVALSIVNFLKQQLDSDALGLDSRESVEVAVQCIETAFELSGDDADAVRPIDLVALVRARAPPGAVAADAERLKNEGNQLMKEEKFREALAAYSRAIELEPRNAVYFCNRAAAHFKLGSHEAAVADCAAALGLQPDYGKAHGRLGLALTALDRHREARTAFARAAQLDPGNESYRQNLRLADERLAARGDRPSLDLGPLLHNPALLNMATEMLADPNMQNLISGLMAGAGTGGGGGGGGVAPGDVGAGAGAGVGGGGMSALLEAGQALAQHMQAHNPQLVDALRRQVRAPGGPALPDQPAPPDQPPQQ